MPAPRIQIRRLATVAVVGAAIAFTACSDGTSPRGGSSSGTVPAQPAAATPRMQEVLDQFTALGPKPLETLTPAEARQQPTPADAVAALLAKQGRSAPTDQITTSDRTIRGAAGELPARVYTPSAGQGPLPALLYFHGGGFVIADKDVYDSSARALAQAATCVVLSVDYRRGPEHRFPAAHDDAVSAYRWLIANAATIGADPKRIAVGGESAGGNLAANVAIAARDAGLQPPTHALLVYPIASSDMSAPSFQEHADAKPLNQAMMAWFSTHYLRSPADAQDPRIDLVSARLSGLPTTTIITAEIDPLRSGGEQLAIKLEQAGTAIEHRQFAGVTHEFFGMGAVVPEAEEAVAYAGSRLERSFAQPAR